MAGTSNQVPEWHSDESGVVRLVDPAGQAQRYEMKRLVPYGERMYVVLQPYKNTAPFLVAEYTLGWNGDAWVAPVFHRALTLIILCLGLASDAESRTNSRQRITA